MQGVTIRNMFGRNANQSGLVDPVGTSRTRSVIMIDNASDVTVENVLAKVGGHPMDLCQSGSGTPARLPTLVVGAA